MLRRTKVVPLEPADAATAEATNAGMDAELDGRARAALRGDPAALRAFLLAVAPIVRRVCRTVMGRHNVELEDTIQDCLIDVARALPQFRFEGSVSHYVAKIAMRRAIGCRDRARARSKQHTPLDVSHLSLPSADAPVESRADLVGNLLDRLSEAQSKALLLRMVLGHSIDEIASITGVSVNTVKTRLRLAKEQLRRWLPRSGEGRLGRG
jgi:RNA polymerase sigma factor (sigma-70 family)